MKELVIISGKGGTGKTSVTGAIASLTENKILCDADVDAADLHLITGPTIQSRHAFQGGHTAVINRDQCTECGQCLDICNFQAIGENFHVDPIECEGCGVCVYFCPEKAIDFPINTCGEWFVSKTRFGAMVHARLGIAEENSGKLVTLVRNKARELAEKDGADLILTDGPPGVGCPVIASVGNADAALVITEPTVSGIHDLKRILQLTEHFKIPSMVSINKFDLNMRMTDEIVKFIKTTPAEYMGPIPFDKTFTLAMVQAKTILEYDGDSEAGRSLKRLCRKVIKKLGA